MCTSPCAQNKTCDSKRWAHWSEGYGSDSTISCRRIGEYLPSEREWSSSLYFQSLSLILVFADHSLSLACLLYLFREKKNRKNCKEKRQMWMSALEPHPSCLRVKVVFPAFLIMVTSILHGGSSDWKKERKVANAGAIFLKASHECIRH